MKKFTSFILAAGLLTSLVACGSTASSSTAAPSVASAAESSNEKLLVTDIAAGTVTIACEVNAKYFTESTRHGIVFAEGSNGEKSVLRGLANEKDFYNGLIEIGAIPGNNLTMDDMQAKASANGVAVEGSALNVMVRWEGAEDEIPFADLITASETRPMDIRFGGNLAAAEEKNTGCILCLDSCAVGITSNAAYPTGTTQNDEVQFFGKEDVLPADGTRVYVTFRVAEGAASSSAPVSSPVSVSV